MAIENKLVLKVLAAAGKVLFPEEAWETKKLQIDMEKLRTASILAQLKNRPIGQIEDDLLGRF